MESEKRWAGKGWIATFASDEFVLDTAAGVRGISAAEADGLELRRRWLRWRLVHGDLEVLRLRGADADGFDMALRRLVVRPQAAAAVAWQESVTSMVATAKKKQRWITTENVEALIQRRPPSGLVDRIRAAGYADALTNQEREAAEFVDSDLDALVAGANDDIMRAELRTRRRFFDTIEKTPLSEEQARAVVCFDNRVQVVAAAGSGKTSVMVPGLPTPCPGGWSTLIGCCWWRSTRRPQLNFRIGC